jgi:hypothetical protein
MSDNTILLEIKSPHPLKVASRDSYPDIRKEQQAIAQLTKEMKDKQKNETKLDNEIIANDNKLNENKSADIEQPQQKIEQSADNKVKQTEKIEKQKSDLIDLADNKTIEIELDDENKNFTKFETEIKLPKDYNIPSAPTNISQNDVKIAPTNNSTSNNLPKTNNSTVNTNQVIVNPSQNEKKVEKLENNEKIEQPQQKNEKSTDNKPTPINSENKGIIKMISLFGIGLYLLNITKMW